MKPIPTKCKICGFDKFEFVLENHMEEIGTSTHDVGYYKCKRCGAK